MAKDCELVKLNWEDIQKIKSDFSNRLYEKDNGYSVFCLQGTGHYRLSDKVRSDLENVAKPHLILNLTDDEMRRISADSIKGTYNDRNAAYRLLPDAVDKKEEAHFKIRAITDSAFFLEREFPNGNIPSFIKNKANIEKLEELLGFKEFMLKANMPYRLHRAAYGMAMSKDKSGKWERDFSYTVISPDELQDIKNDLEFSFADFVQQI